MFPGRYFGGRYFAPTFWAKVGSAVAAIGRALRLPFKVRRLPPKRRR